MYKYSFWGYNYNEGKKMKNNKLEILKKTLKALKQEPKVPLDKIERFEQQIALMEAQDD